MPRTWVRGRRRSEVGVIGADCLPGFSKVSSIVMPGVERALRWWVIAGGYSGFAAFAVALGLLVMSSAGKFCHAKRGEMLIS